MWFIGVEVEQETSAPPPKKILDPPLVSLVLSTINPLLHLIRYMTICIVHRRRLQLDSTSGQVNVVSWAARVRLLQIAFFVFNRHACSVTATNPFLLVCMSLCFPCSGIFFFFPCFVCVCFSYQFYLLVSFLFGEKGEGGKM